MELFYYFRDSKKKPIVTICLKDNGEASFSRGIAICSLMDNPNKKVGNQSGSTMFIYILLIYRY